ncbi:MAG: DUF86 domain-containing protein [Candidatus Pacearchaeota archaeon]|jgi:uncharacterized protein with HEPN domain
MLKYNLYVKDILKAIKLIEETTKKKNFNSFVKDKNLIDATAMRIQIIGESCKKIPDKIKRPIKEVNWSYLEGLRNVISHAYFKISSELLWDIIKSEIPLLKKVVKRLKI